MSAKEKQIQETILDGSGEDEVTKVAKDSGDPQPSGCSAALRRFESKLVVRNDTLREFLAEFIGMFVLMILGLSSIAQYVLSRGKLGDFLSINIAWGLAVAFGVWVAGPVTGGHLNPAVTGAMFALGKLTFCKMCVYFIAQYLAAFIAAGCVFSIYHDAINDFDGGVRKLVGANATAGIFANYPQKYLSVSSAFGDQVVGTMFLLLLVMAISDERSKMKVPDGLFPGVVGLIITSIGLGLGLNCGYPINPARDLAPRIFTAIAGWGPGVFFLGNFWFWVPVVAPHIGGVCGVFLYRLTVGLHLPDA